MISKISKRLNLRKDQGFAWCILVLSFLSHTAHTGFLFSILGTTVVAHKDLYKLDIQQSSLIGSVQVGLFFFFAPVASIMVKRISCRVTQLIGGSALILGIGLSSLAKQVWHTYILYSCIAAFGVSCCYMASSEILSLHFEKYKYLAFALACFGYYIGMSVLPIASQKLFASYDYHFAMGIMAALHIIHIIAGVLYFTPESDDTKSKAITNAQKKEKKEEVQLMEQDTEQANGDLVSDGGKRSLSLLESFKVLLTSPKVWSLVCNSFFWAFNINSYLILLNDYMIERLSISPDEAALGITITGIGNLVGNCIVIAVSRLKFDRIILHAACSLLFGIFTMVISASVNKVMFYALAASWGLAQGAHLANLLAVVHEFCGAEQLPLLFGVNLFAEGISSMSAAPLCSYAASKLGSMAGLILSGSFGVIASVALLPVIIYNYQCKSTPSEKASSTHDASEVNARLTDTIGSEEHT